jgi:hypothetical protein
LFGWITPECAPWLLLDRFEPYPAAAVMRRDLGDSLFSLELRVPPDQAAAWLREWDGKDYVKLTLRTDPSYFGSPTEEVNAKDFVTDLWVTRDGHEHSLRMLVSGHAGPYQVYAALAGKASWIEAAAVPARRHGFFAPVSQEHASLLSPWCETCGRDIPQGLMGEPWGDKYCPRCQDFWEGRFVAGLDRV